ncbi:GreA/GreB family elongation factor [Adhaeribacter rhizoryzae]|uniref:Transcription elongation factor GreAB n=1 Tax=Adhaeribacter rhizoryzae TaxID=2607907 RepID=A0A5M6D4H9_9BACT|nr:GreA/GreB family elongation factor [Adhaeribacter rhizoryzae]KAA5541202.1 transcription elongation factor GreAB [Adhaeribacter rhizoryzae]
MNTIYLTEDDYQQLVKLIQGQPKNEDLMPAYIRLKAELKRAKRVPSVTIPPEVVTMNSRVRVQELKSNSEMILSVVFPHEANFNAGKISVLSPIGTAILGSRAGDEVVWTAPYCKFIYKIKEVLYQPEADGVLADEGVLV